MVEFETLKQLVSAGRRRTGTALEIAGRRTPYRYEDFCTNCYKAANLFGQYGGHPGGRIDVVVGPKPEFESNAAEPIIHRPAAGTSDRGGRFTSAAPLYALVGGTLIGATVAIQPDPIDSRVLVAPTGWQTRYDLPPGCSVLGYGGPPESAEVAHFEAECWSQNPTEPPEPVDPTDSAVRMAGEQFTHAEVCELADRTARDLQLDANTRLGLTAPLRTPAAVIGGVLAPLSVGATVVVGPSAAALHRDHDAELVLIAERTTEENPADHDWTVPFSTLSAF